MTGGDGMLGALRDAAARMLTERVLPRIDHRLEDSVRPFDRDDLFRPHHRSRRWGWTHFGVFLPDAPDPYRYLNTMTLIGATGTTCFDNDHLAAPDARDTTTVLSSTAGRGQHHYAAYDASTDCRFADDGRRLEWGEDLVLRVALPEVTVEASYESFDAHVELTTTQAASWFVRTFAYDHVSLLAPYRATITDQAGTHRFAGLGTVEYARCVTPQAFRRRALPEALKIPVDFFTYQIITLDADTQLLLTDVRAAGATACRLAHLRTRDGTTHVFSDVSFEVLDYGDEQLDPIGRAMRVPARMRWTVRDGGDEPIRLEATVDTPWRWGHGRGYVGAYSFTGHRGPTEIAGSGYVEWIDCRRPS